MSTPTQPPPGSAGFPPFPGNVQGTTAPIHNVPVPVQVPQSIQVHEVSNDGLWGAISGSDYNSVHPAPGRSKTGDTPQKAMKNTWDPGFNAAIGPGSVGKYVKVRLSDLPGHVAPPIKVSISPSTYGTRSKSDRQRHIPDYPHTCNLCGGKMLWLFTSQEHEGGVECPAIVKAREAEERGDTRFKFKRKGRP